MRYVGFATLWAAVFAVALLAKVPTVGPYNPNSGTAEQCVATALRDTGRLHDDLFSPYLAPTRALRARAEALGPALAAARSAAQRHDIGRRARMLSRESYLWSHVIPLRQGLVVAFVVLGAAGVWAVWFGMVSLGCILLMVGSFGPLAVQSFAMPVITLPIGLAGMMIVRGRREQRHARQSATATKGADE